MCSPTWADCRARYDGRGPPAPRLAPAPPHSASAMPSRERYYPPVSGQGHFDRRASVDSVDRRQDLQNYREPDNRDRPGPAAYERRAAPIRADGYEHLPSPMHPEQYRDNAYLPPPAAYNAAYPPPPGPYSAPPFDPYLQHRSTLR